MEPNREMTREELIGELNRFQSLYEKAEAALKERETVALNRAADLVNDKGLWTLAAEIRALANKPEGK